VSVSRRHCREPGGSRLHRGICLAMTLPSAGRLSSPSGDLPRDDTAESPEALVSIGRFASRRHYREPGGSRLHRGICLATTLPRARRLSSPSGICFATTLPRARRLSSPSGDLPRDDTAESPEALVSIGGICLATTLPSARRFSSPVIRRSQAIVWFRPGSLSF